MSISTCLEKATRNTSHEPKEPKPRSRTRTPLSGLVRPGLRSHFIPLCFGLSRSNCVRYILPELFVVRSWNPHYELRTCALALTMSFDRRAMQFEQILNHRESDAETTLMNVCGHFTLEKYIKDVREVSSSYPHAAVSNGHDLPTRLLK